MKHLIFDFGGVRVLLDKARIVHNFARLGFDITPYLGTYRQAGVFSELERGTISIKDFCAEIRRLAGEEHAALLTDEAIIAAWQSYLTEIPLERLRTLERLRKNYRLYALSNTNEIHWRMGLDDLFRRDGKRFEDYFDGAFLSYELKMEKPEPALYRHIIDSLGGKGEDCLFFDDSIVNCEAAIACGLPARLAPSDGSWMQLFDEEGRLCE